MTCDYLQPPPPWFINYACAVLAACVGLTFFPSLLYLIRGGGARFRRPSRERTLADTRELFLHIRRPAIIALLTGQFCREWHMKRSIAISSTSWEPHNPGKPMHRRYHLGKRLEQYLRDGLRVTDELRLTRPYFEL